jgi:hypothetical protein
MNNIFNEEKVLVTNNEFDYSNSVPTIEYVTYLVQYCDNIYKHFLSLIEEDKKRNEKFKDEYKNYNYKKSFREEFEIYIKLKSYNNITCNDFNSFKTAIEDGNLNNVNGIDIKLNLSYERGKGKDLIKHENSFSIIFNPYNIVFARKSSHNEPEMNQIENNINEILKKFPVVNTIFCTKN